MYEIDMDNISYEEAFDADSHFSADDLSSAQFGWLAAAGVAIAGVGMLLYNCLENASEYRDIKEKYNAHPAGREANYWETVKDGTHSADRALDDYTYVTYIPISNGKTTTLMPIFHHHSPNPQSAMSHINTVRESLSACGDGAASNFSDALSTIEQHISDKNYDTAMKLLSDLSEQAKTVQAPYIAQTQPLYDSMNSAFSASVWSGIGAAAAGTGAAVAGIMAANEDEYY